MISEEQATHLVNQLYKELDYAINAYKANKNEDTATAVIGQAYAYWRRQMIDDTELERILDTIPAQWRDDE